MRSGRWFFDDLDAAVLGEPTTAALDFARWREVRSILDSKARSDRVRISGGSFEEKPQTFRALFVQEKLGFIVVLRDGEIETAIVIEVSGADGALLTIRG